jgi:RsiW-degrading membrane proteinase PrsW (M82 family)
MTFLALCCWSPVLIYSYLVRVKYHWSAPRHGLNFWALLAGLAAAPPALLCNNFLSRETELWIFSSNLLHSYLGFMIGAGFGEEFWKMGAASIVVLAVTTGRRPLRGVDCVLIYVTVALSFAMIENAIGYGNLSPALLMLRGVTAVPVHGTLGLIQGLAARQALASGRLQPLILGYFGAVALHTLWDTVGILWQAVLGSDGFTLPRIVITYTCALICAGLTLRAWHRLPEVPQLSPAEQRAG